MTTVSDARTEVPALRELLDRIEEIKPILVEDADETEAHRRVAQANIDALAAAGVFKVMVPGRYGGYETTIADTSSRIAGVLQSCERRPARRRRP